MYMILFVLDNPKKLDEILDAWEGIGIEGVTIAESTGIHRRHAQRIRLPMRFMAEPLVMGGEEGNYLLFTIVKEEEMVQKCIQATESIIGNLDDPNTGVLAAWPLSVVRGLHLPDDSATGEI
ncbi:MAG: hypothetical protein GYA59_06665 [Chloroflexi bacterium]|nr:hypothetical protein [Chloroflexota bacterium]